MVFSNDQFFVLKLATIVGAILSLGGTLFIMLTFSKLKDKLNSLPNRIILYLSISDMLGSIGYLLDINNRANISKEDFMCFTSAVFQQYFPLSSFFWMACFSHNLYLIFCSKNIIQEEKIERNFHILCWGKKRLFFFASFLFRFILFIDETKYLLIYFHSFKKYFSSIIIIIFFFLPLLQDFQQSRA